MKRLWRNYVTAGGRVEENQLEYRRVYLINVMLLFTLAVTIIFFHVHLFWTGFMNLLLVNLAAFVATLTATIYFRATCHIEHVSSFLNLIAFVALGVYLLFTHDEDQAYMWAAVYFPLAYFLKGRYVGSLYSGIFFLMIVAGAIYHMTAVNPETLPVIARTLMNMGASVLALCGTLYYYESTRVEAIGRLRSAQAKLLELSTTDGLTGLYNRRHFDDVMPLLIAKCRRENGILSFLTLDVDYFKAYNDCYGHPKGDLVLQAIARVLKNTLKRTSDLNFRLGGEEFGALFTVTEPAEAEALAEAVRANVEALAIPSLDSPLGKVTISIGLRLYQPGASPDTASACTLASEADQALYQAKHQGRNRVVVYRQD